ncbi:unnamed protein product [Rotaria sp. Silwood1]|nr:unnamed protein product [Rotaria sp. Silwood1]
MAKATQGTVCVKCELTKSFATCKGCSKDFCRIHINEHHTELSDQLGKTEDQFNEFKIEMEGPKIELQKQELMKQIDEWERESIEKIHQVANEVRHKLSLRVNKFATDLNFEFKELTKSLIQCRKEEDFIETRIDFFNEKLKKLQDTFNNPSNFKIEHYSTCFINKIHLVTKTSLLRSAILNADAKWIRNGVTVAGGNGVGSDMNQLYCPNGLCVDNDQTIYIAECTNHRIAEWTCGATTGRVVAGGNGKGNRPDQLSGPADVIIDKERDSLIICDYHSQRVVRWPRQNDITGETIISNVGCWGLTMDDDGFLYVVDYDNHEVRRYRMGESQGTVVAGGNGQGNHLNQLSNPRYVFVDYDHSVYVSDYGNHRVMKWMEGAKQGIVVAGGRGQGNRLNQLSNPCGVIVDQLGTVYIADHQNHRIVRWPQAATQGNIIVGENGGGSDLNQLSAPIGLSFDQEGIPNIPVKTRWAKNGVTVAEDHEAGNATNQLDRPFGLFDEDDGTIFIADHWNDRIVQWKVGDTNGQVVAGGFGGGNPLNGPTDVLINKETDSLTICDWENRRVLRWSRRSGTIQGENLIKRIDCYGLTIDDQRYLYISDIEKHEVRRFQIGEKNGTLVAGGNDKGADLNQLNRSTFLFVDGQQAVYVSDTYNHRVMK